MQTPMSLAQTRTPQTCHFRVCGRDGVACCELLRQLVDFDDVDARVDLPTCVACCRFPEPTAACPNKVVASLIHGMASDHAETTTDPGAFVRAQERVVWIEQFLEVAGSSRPSTVFERRVWESVQRAQSWIERRWRRHRRDRRRIGLVGPNNAKGLGHQNRDLMKWLAIDEWFGLKELDHGSAPSQHSQHVRKFLRSIDVLLFVETPFFGWLPQLARELGVRVVCVPNWEWLHPGLPWLKDVDAMICPTRRTFDMLTRWRQQFGFRWELQLCPWPIDVAAIPFQLRQACRRFVFVNGTNQDYPPRRDGTPTAVRRKGLEWLVEAARRLPEVPFVVWSQTDEALEVPGNVSLRRSVFSNTELYQDGDVCVQLSRWEGLGLPLLECQAAGMPLITIDEAPMNEHNPMSTVRVIDHELLELWPRRWIAAPRLAVDDVVATLSNWIGKDISAASRRAREFVEREHDWRQVRETLLDWIVAE